MYYVCEIAISFRFFGRNIRRYKRVERLSTVVYTFYVIFNRRILLESLSSEGLKYFTSLKPVTDVPTGCCFVTPEFASRLIAACDLLPVVSYDSRCGRQY
jgi:hypothetical protein